MKFSDILAWLDGLPGPVMTAVEIAVGTEWPEGEEERMWDLSDAWNEMALDINDVISDLGETVPTITSQWRGASAESFQELWEQFQGGDESVLPMLSQAAAGLSTQAREGGLNIQSTKYEIMFELFIMIVALIIALAAAIWTAGLSTIGGAAATTAARMTIQQLFRMLVRKLAEKGLKALAKEFAQKLGKEMLERFIKRQFRNVGRDLSLRGLAREMAQEAFEEGAVNAATQAMQMADGDRTNFNAGELGQSILMGGVAGLGAGLASALGARGITKSVLGEMGGDVAARLASGDIPSLEDLARAGAAGAVGSTTHGVGRDSSGMTNQLTNALRNAVNGLPAVGGAPSLTGGEAGAGAGAGTGAG
ncbi:MAG: WXG100 family type VII secretion target, partial [Solirubrobacteraceae bacterium]